MYGSFKSLNVGGYEITWPWSMVQEWDDVLCDNILGYEYNFVFYPFPEAYEGEVYKANSLSDLLNLLIDARINIEYTSGFLNGCKIAAEEIVHMLQFVAPNRAVWADGVYIEVSITDDTWVDTEPYGVIDNTNNDTFDGRW